MREERERPALTNGRLMLLMDVHKPAEPVLPSGCLRWAEAARRDPLVVEVFESNPSLAKKVSSLTGGTPLVIALRRVAADFLPGRGYEQGPVFRAMEAEGTIQRLTARQSQWIVEESRRLGKDVTRNKVTAGRPVGWKSGKRVGEERVLDELFAALPEAQQAAILMSKRGAATDLIADYRRRTGVNRTQAYEDLKKHRNGWRIEALAASTRRG